MPDALPAFRRLAGRLPLGLVRFLAVGVVGLATNIGLLLALERGGLPLWAALAISLIAATLVTWVLNRRHTFSASGRAAHHEALRYFGVALVAQSVSYATTLAMADLLPHVPHGACAFVGAVVATLFSYTGQRFFTFAPDAATPASMQAAAVEPAAD